MSVKLNRLEKRIEREQVARKRIVSILKKQVVANWRTLEHKIGDAGPNPVRVQPHILTPAKRELMKKSVLGVEMRGKSSWFYLAGEDREKINARLAELWPIWDAFTEGALVGRTGQALEIAVFKALLAAPGINVFGGYTDLNAHDDSTLYSKQEVQAFNGASLGKQALDFIISVGSVHCGIEVKNTRPWYYAHDADLREAIRKALTLKVVPVFVARRIQYVSFRVLGACGVIMHETYNQRMASADTALADLARHKDLLGYHDIRVSNDPDPRMTRFFNDQLPGLAEAAVAKLDAFHDLLWAFATNEMPYAEFSARVRRREQGLKEDNDWPEQEEGQYDPYDYE